jgi:SAM-dependent methyltransferase
MGTVVTDFDAHERRMWAGRATAFDDSVAHLCAYPASTVLDAASVTSGVRVLDVGTGSGTVAALASARGAIVTAVDAEPSMVELTRSRVPAADVRHATLPDLPFPDDAFDAVVANFVVNHVGDPGAAVAELRRVTRPGGRIAVSVWPYPPSPLHALWDQVLDAADARPRTAVPTVSDALNFERTAPGLAALLRSAGLIEVATETIAWVHRVSAEDWWRGPATGVATVGQIVTSQSPEMIAHIKRQYDRISAAYVAEDGLLALPTSAYVASGMA